MIFLVSYKNVMFIMCNPSHGGNPEILAATIAKKEKNIEELADPTINRILKAADANMFGLLKRDEKWTGIYIRNLFTYRSPKPKDLVDKIKIAKNRFINEEKNQETKKTQEFKDACRNNALKEFGWVGSDLREWETTAKKCERS